MKENSELYWCWKLAESLGKSLQEFYKEWRERANCGYDFYAGR